MQLKPFLKWAGGKRQLLPILLKEIPSQFHCYYEPFLGAGALLFAMKPKKAIVNDANEQLINSYLIIRDKPDELLQLLKEHNQKNSPEYYYAVRDIDRDDIKFKTVSDVEKAARLIYLNKTCYNGLYRVNKSGCFNVPFGKYKKPAIVDEANLRAISIYLNNADIIFHSGDFEKISKLATENDFVYFDPPYHSFKINFTGYQATGFNEKDQKRLAKLYHQLTKQGIYSLLSNSDTPFIRNLFKKHEIKTVSATRLINSISSERGRINEVLVKNY